MSRDIIKLGLLLIGVTLIPSLVLISLAASNSAKLINFFPDDAFYYLQTAYRFSENGLLSFDAENSTTGFHPLQMMMSIAIFNVFSKESALFAFFLLNPICYALALIILVRSLELKKNRMYWASLGCLAIFNIHVFASSGMESGLLTLIAATFFYLFIKIIKKDDLNLNDAIAVGVAAALLSLARLDMVIPLTVLGLTLFAVFFRRGQFRWLAISLLSFLIVISPYFIWMYSTQGSFMPVSSLAKYGRAQSNLLITI